MSSHDGRRRLDAAATSPGGAHPPRQEPEGQAQHGGTVAAWPMMDGSDRQAGKHHAGPPRRRSDIIISSSHLGGTSATTTTALAPIPQMSSETREPFTLPPTPQSLPAHPRLLSESSSHPHGHDPGLGLALSQAQEDREMTGPAEHIPSSAGSAALERAVTPTQEWSAYATAAKSSSGDGEDVMMDMDVDSYALAPSDSPRQDSGQEEAAVQAPFELDDDRTLGAVAQQPRMERDMVTQPQSAPGPFSSSVVIRRPFRSRYSDDDDASSTQAPELALPTTSHKRPYEQASHSPPVDHHAAPSGASAAPPPPARSSLFSSFDFGSTAARHELPPAPRFSRPSLAIDADQASLAPSDDSERHPQAATTTFSARSRHPFDSQRATPHALAHHASQQQAASASLRARLLSETAATNSPLADSLSSSSSSSSSSRNATATAAQSSFLRRRRASSTLAFASPAAVAPPDAAANEASSPWSRFDRPDRFKRARAGSSDPLSSFNDAPGRLASSSNAAASTSSDHSPRLDGERRNRFSLPSFGSRRFSGSGARPPPAVREGIVPPPVLPSLAEPSSPGNPTSGVRRFAPILPRLPFRRSSTGAAANMVTSRVSPSGISSLLDTPAVATPQGPSMSSYDADSRWHRPTVSASSSALDTRPISQHMPFTSDRLGAASPSHLRPRSARTRSDPERERAIDPLVALRREERHESTTSRNNRLRDIELETPPSVFPPAATSSLDRLRTAPSNSPPPYELNDLTAFLPSPPADSPPRDDAEESMLALPSTRHLPPPSEASLSPPVIGVRLRNTSDAGTAGGGHPATSQGSSTSVNPGLLDHTRRPALWRRRTARETAPQHREDSWGTPLPIPTSSLGWDEHAEAAEAERFNQGLIERRAYWFETEQSSPGTSPPRDGDSLWMSFNTLPDREQDDAAPPRGEEVRASLLQRLQAMPDSQEATASRESMWGELSSNDWRASRFGQRRMRGPTERANELWRRGESMEQSQLATPTDGRNSFFDRRGGPPPLDDALGASRELPGSLLRIGSPSPRSRARLSRQRNAVDPDSSQDERDAPPTREGFRRRSTFRTVSFDNQRAQLSPPGSPSGAPPSLETGSLARLRLANELSGGRAAARRTEADERPPSLRRFFGDRTEEYGPGELFAERQRGGARAPLMLASGSSGRRMVFPDPAFPAGPVSPRLDEQRAAEPGDASRRRNTRRSSLSEALSNLDEARSRIRRRRDAADTTAGETGLGISRRGTQPEPRNERLVSRLRAQRDREADLPGIFGTLDDQDDDDDDFLAFMPPLRNRQSPPPAGRRPDYGGILRRLTGALGAFEADAATLFGGLWSPDSLALDPRNYMHDDDLDTSYEALIRLSERVGEAKPRGLTARKIDELHTFLYRDWVVSSQQQADTAPPQASTSSAALDFAVDPQGRALARKGIEKEERCAVCLTDYEDDELIMMSSCRKHGFHADCLRQWLVKNGSCPVCRA